MKTFEIATRFRRMILATSIGFILIAIAPSPARADLVIGIADVTAVAGSSTNSFDVTLTNNGAMPSDNVTIAGSQFQITAPGSDVTFTDVTVFTQGSYIFGSNSEFGPSIILSSPGSTVLAEDNYFTNPPVSDAGATLAVGQTLDLGHVVFTLDPSTPAGAIQLSFDLTNTVVNDPESITLPVTLPSGVDSQIEVTSAVPEPASILIGIQGLIFSVHLLRRHVAKRRSQIND